MLGLLLVSAGAPFPASSAARNTEKAGTKTTENKKEKDPVLSVTDHTVRIDGREVKYKATAGYMLLKDFADKKKKGKKSDSEKDSEDKDGRERKTRAKIFFIAYTREDAGNLEKRPLTFSFNGGPGSASVWLHMGGLGPRRAVLTDRGEALPPPYRLEDNAFSWLDKTDLVFIDPVSTGYSRTEPGEDPKSFHGYKEDIESVGEFIRLYITRYKRWSSPKIIVGESYGTTRAAGLSDFLQQRYGIYLNGIALVSSVLNFATLDFSPNNDMPYVLFLPSYTATAWYHRKLSPELQDRPLHEVLKEAEDFASGDYLLSLFKGDKLGKARKDELAGRLSRLTGLDAGYLGRLDCRLSDSLFFTHLLMDQNRQVGRFDSRFTGIRFNPGTDRNDFDPSFEAVNGPFSATFNDYVRRELEFESDLPYETLADVWPWSFKHFENRYLNVADDLRKAMTRNPYLKVWISSGYYDLATPYFATRYTVDQMSLDPAIARNISLTFYDAGHMLYVHRPSLEKFKADISAFLDSAVLPDSAVVPSAKPGDR
ncbi:MAG: peptidase S10 [Candidatus Melainabacteria bacterium]|nr:peptidase S10 [Candidatus Melainabacteria bacterium]